MGPLGERELDHVARSVTETLERPQTQDMAAVA